MATKRNSPRNGEGNHAQHGGGVEKRVRHRTVGASKWNVCFARKLRRQLTLPEIILWQHLRKRPKGLRFRRQFPCDGYVIDFACLDRRLAIEIDGEVHSMGDRPHRDAMRDTVLNKAGFQILRIAARDVLDNLDGVITHILNTCGIRPHHRSASPSGPPPRFGEDF